MSRSDPSTKSRALSWVIAVIGMVTVIAAVLLWPRGEAPSIDATSASLPLVRGVVTEVASVPCFDAYEGVNSECQSVTFERTSGAVPPTPSAELTFLASTLDLRVPTFAEGDRVVLTMNEQAPEEFRFTFLDFERRASLVVLAIVFAIAVIAFGRWRGVRALGGLALSLAVVFVFLLPALLRDQSPLATALVATSLIAYSAIYFTHGVSITTTVALAGTLVSVAVIAGGATLFTHVASITGLSDEGLQTLTVTAGTIDPRAILVAGIVIGALGVLDDVTITQVSAVAELRKANPTMSPPELYASAVRIGRDHIASTVNTLALAYVGASLSMMLFFFQEGRSVGQVLTGEVVAIELVRMLIGSVGLVLSVPVTTALAAYVADTDQLEATHSHGHSHGDSDPHAQDHMHRHSHGRDSSEPSWDDFAPRSSNDDQR